MASVEHRILIVDDEAVVRDSLSRLFEDEGYKVKSASGAKAALEGLEPGDYDLALLDIRMPGMDGMQLQEKLRQVDPDMLVVVMTDYASVETAVQTLKQGAWDYVVKPIDPDELLHIIGKALEHRAAKREVERLRENLQEFVMQNELVGCSTAIRHVIEKVVMVAPTDTSVLITGESGTGKEVVARMIHANSPRKHMPMVVIHCGALTDTLLESELFGHEKGAFPGAQFRRKGKFEVADGGTVFLDEIAEISLRTQTDLLRVLQEKEVVRVGGTQPVKVDFRCVAATNKRLEDLVKGGTFRPDLYYRLHVFTINLPPLRERREDIPLLVQHFLRKICESTNRSVPKISDAAMQLLVSHDWPGNVRELENAVERALVVGRNGEIGPQHFALGMKMETISCGRSLEEVERAHIERMVDECEGNMSKAARILGIDRTTLYAKLKRYKTA